MTKEKEIYNKAKKFIPGGVNSPVRSFDAVNGDPIYVDSAKGAYLITVTGQKLLDFCNSWGALILGHSHPEIIKEIFNSSKKGISYGLNHAAEVELAEIISCAIPSIQKIRMVSSGTEAVMTAVRLARGYTGKEKILKFAGCYHGHYDSLLIKGGSGLLTQGIPSSNGVPRSISSKTLVCPYNQISSFEKILKKYHNDLACVILEPVAGNMGVILPEKNFLTKLRALTKSYGILLIFDEVITGFRFTYGGYQNLIKLKPDLTCLGKIIGGGMPLAALGGNKNIMNNLAPLGKVYQAGTLSGNPLAVKAGLLTLKILKRNNPYLKLNSLAKYFFVKLAAIFKKHKIPMHISWFGSMFTIFCGSLPLNELKEVEKCDTARYARMHRFFLTYGIFLPPSQFEACFFSSKHLKKELDYFADVMETFLNKEEGEYGY